MAKFRFQFEAVLNVRKSREQDALIALGAAQRNYQHEVAMKHQLQLALRDALARREALGTEATPVLAFQIEQAFINGTKQRMVRADQAIVRASRLVEKALRAYLFARRQTRMIEALEDKAREEFRRERARKEARENDELATMRARLAADGPFAMGDAPAGLEADAGFAEVNA